MEVTATRTLSVVDADSARKPKKAAANAVKKPRAKKASATKLTSKSAKKTSKKTISKTPAKAAQQQTKVPKKKTEKIEKVTLNSKKSTTGLRREPLGHLLLTKKLREVGFAGTIETDKETLRTFSTDESIFAITPQIVITPEDGADVEKAVQVVAAETSQFSALSLTPRAAGTGLSGGSLTDSIVINVRPKLNHIGDVVEKNGETFISCGPGAWWRDVEKKLKKHNVYLPSFPASKDLCTIGGSVANNAAGPDSLKYGHTAESVASLRVVLHDGNTYTIAPLSHKELQQLTKKKNALATIASEVFTLIEKNEKTINAAKPHTQKNTAGYPLWDVIDTSVKEFKAGKGTFDLTRLFSGSQGTIGVITEITLRTVPIATDTTLVVLPIFDLESAGKAIQQALTYDPVNVEIFDGLTFDLALKNPEFFKDRLSRLDYCRVMLQLYTTYHVRYRKQIPEFTLLVTIPNETIEAKGKPKIVDAFRETGCQVVRFVKSDVEQEMWWQIRRASYTLSKLQDPSKRPAAFLEDLTVPPKNLLPFFADVRKLFKKYNITAAIHGHGGNGHFHFYPLLDFTDKTTPNKIEKMSEEFFSMAISYEGSICGEHNDGIIRTPHLSKMFNKTTLQLFAKVEHLFDPDDIFNPGKKVNPRFDIKDSLRTTN